MAAFPFFVAGRDMRAGGGKGYPDARHKFATAAVLRLPLLASARFGQLIAHRNEQRDHADHAAVTESGIEREIAKKV